MRVTCEAPRGVFDVNERSMLGSRCLSSLTAAATNNGFRGKFRRVLPKGNSKGRAYHTPRHGGPLPPVPGETR